MEFEKIKAIIAEVLNVDENEITMETTFTANEDAEKIVTVGDAVEQIKNALA